MRMEASDHARKVLLYKPVGQRITGRPRMRLLDNVEADLRNVGIRSWTRRALDWHAWKEIFEEVNAHNGL